MTAPSGTGMPWALSSSHHLTPLEMIAVAYSMEEGLGAFYRAALEKSEAPDVRDLILRLAGFEEKHKQALLGFYREIEPERGGEKELEEQGPPAVMEGGFEMAAFLRENERHLGNTEDLLNMAMMLETQALDLYHRFAGKAGRNEVEAVLFRIAQEEKLHLTLLGDLLEKTV